MNEFQKILDRRGQFDTSPLFPLAHLGLARAAALAGDTTKSRKAYQDFFALWKDADVDIPILIEAKQEYEKVKVRIDDIKISNIIPTIVKNATARG